MAEIKIIKRKKGDYYQFYGSLYGDRFYVTLGYAKRKVANKCLELVDCLESEQLHNQLSLKTKDLLSEVAQHEPKFIKRLVKAGLCRNDESRMTVSDLFDLHMNTPGVADNKPRTRNTIRNDQKHFLMWLKSKGAESNAIADLTKQDVREWIEWLKVPVEMKYTDEKGVEQTYKKKAFAKSTIGNTLKNNRSPFLYAKSEGWISSSPIPSAGKEFPRVKTKEKQQIQNEIVTKEFVDKVLGLDWQFEWEVLVNIVRYHGFRIGSILILRWSDIDLDAGIFRVVRVKDEGNGRDREQMTTLNDVPIAPELLPLLIKAQKLAGKNVEHVLNNILKLDEKPEFAIYNDADKVVVKGRYDTTASTTYKKKLIAAGLPVYPQPFHALRDFRCNELEKLGFSQNKSAT